MYTKDLEALYTNNDKLDQANQQHYFETVLLYVFNVGELISEYDLKERLTMEGRKKLMTIAEKLRQEGRMEGIQKGRQEGREEGRQEGEAIGIQKGKHEALMDIVHNMLSLGKSETEIMQITGLSSEKIKKIIAEINR